MGDGFYRSKDPTNSIKVLKEDLQKKITQRTKKTQNTHAYTQNGKTTTTDSRVGQIMPFFAKLEVNECFLWPNCPLNTNLETKMCCDDVLGR